MYTLYKCHSDSDNRLNPHSERHPTSESETDISESQTERHRLVNRYLVVSWVAVLSVLFTLVSPLSLANDNNSAQFDVSEQAYSYSAANVEIIWLTPEEYSDVRPSNESRRGFRERTTQQLSRFIDRELASFNQQNGTSYRLQMTIRDLDLAGQVWPASFIGLGNGINDVRIVKRLYIPRMTFDFTLSDEQTTHRSEMKYEVKDMNFMQGINRYFRSDSLRYEKHMVAEWLNELLTDVSQPAA